MGLATEQELRTAAPGLGAALLVALIAVFLSLVSHALDPLVLAMLISIIAGNIIGPAPVLSSGIQLSQKVFIPAGIVLYGMQLEARPLLSLGSGPILFILAIVLASSLIVTAVSLRLGINRSLRFLLAAGASICGASAIVVLSPVVKADKEDTSVALIAITIIGLAGVIGYPLFQELFSMSERNYALLCGSTLFQLGQVKAAAALMSANALEMAIPVKLLRIATLLPIAIFYSFLQKDAGKKLPVPWFIVLSIVLAVLMNLIPDAGQVQAFVRPAATFVFSIAVAGIGFSMEIESILDSGLKPILAVLIGWLCMIILFLAGNRLVF